MEARRYQHQPTLLEVTPLATFHTGPQTHPSVLPQQLALELDAADTPGNRDETGVERHGAPGVEHVREETPGVAPGAGGATPAREGGEQHREVYPHVFVLDQHHRPLQPCHPARARTLLAKGRAVVHRRVPFTIRLKDRTAEDSEVDGVEVGVDPGSKYTGIAVFTAQEGQRRGRFSLRLDHRGGQIQKKMGQRAAYRRRRRTANVRYRSPRFLNRTRPEGWLPPSLNHRMVTTVSWVDRFARWAPVRGVHVERVAFDTHALSVDHPVEGVDYQRGTLAGYEVREYLLAKFGRACVYCGIIGVPLNVDHVHPRSRGGSDRVSNLVLACIRCNQAKNNRPVEEFAPKRAAKIKARAKAPLRDAAAAQSTRWALWRALQARLPTHVGTGGRTKYNRTRNHLPKSHTLDALAVGKVDAITETVGTVLVAACAGRGTHARTSPDKHGFPRLRLPRQKTFFGYQTGDLVRAVVPTGKKAGTYTGRVAVRARGAFNITTAYGIAKDIHHRHVRLLQRADGYGYTTRKEEAASSPA